MHSVMNLPSAQNNINTLRTFHDAKENHVHGLAALGQSPVLLLVPIIFRKLPPSDTEKLSQGT